MYYDDDRPRSGCVPGALIIAAALLALGGIFYFGINRAAGAINPFDGRRLNPLAAQPTAISIDRPAVVRQIKALNRLETTTFVMEKVIAAGQEGNPLYNLLFGDKLLLIAHGQVIAGFDLSRLRDEDINLSPDGETATITLPPAEILVSRLDNEKTSVYDQQRGLLNRGDVGLESEARRVAEQEILRAACDEGILARAAEEGQRDLSELVRALGFKQVTINASPGPCTLPGGTPLPAAQPTPAP
ncbi:MAG: DUF4230 domain-containing protein [Chloroflexota bacterium]|nr:DUF4230 domain-containing protein [Chloroflexota bacterium]